VLPNDDVWAWQAKYLFEFDSSAARLWLAAGRLAQHHTAFGLPDTALLGEPPRSLGNDAYASSHRAAVQAIERLDRALGRQPAIEPPQRSLGISL
jgi:hypothetical protein